MPRISNVDWKDKRKPRPISWKEQQELFSRLPEHLFDACTYAVNTGCREQEICQLQWDWEVPIKDLNTSVFVLPEWLTKNGRERVVPLNSVAEIDELVSAVEKIADEKHRPHQSWRCS